MPAAYRFATVHLVFFLSNSVSYCGLRCTSLPSQYPGLSDVLDRYNFVFAGSARGINGDLIALQLRNQGFSDR